MAETELGILQFASFCSTLDTGFWHKLSHKKLNEYKLSEGKVDIWGCYTNGDVAGLPTRLSLDYSAFEKPELISRRYNSPGSLIITNTIEKFKTTDKEQLLKETSSMIWNDICSGAAVTDPSLLTRFHLFTFADLKNYQYHYWFAFPALMPEKPVVASSPISIKSHFNEDQIKSLVASWDGFQQCNPGVGHFLVKISEEQIEVKLLTEFDQVYGNTPQKIVVGFCDPCTLDNNPGWPLRNFLALIAKQWGSRASQLSVICFRDRTREGQRDIGHSLYYDKVELPNYVVADDTTPKSVGWEKNAKNKLTSRKVDLSSSMDPVRLAEGSVDLNLRLMKWRLMPSLDIQLIQQTKCLLLGSGTLGCNVARCLIGWGVRNMTLLDNGKVSYSNPARQSLFQFDDCTNGGKPKAETAAEQLKKIFPGVNAKGVSLSIPMPGHAVGNNADAVEAVKKDCAALEELVKSHDVIYLLMDTRESRWLPTLMCVTMSKLCINAALGFDTYMVMRHGYRPESHQTTPTPASGRGISGDLLGCYYCNDVVAPTDSTRDRTLDQQCTVSRPGLSMIAGALAVELMASVLQHPLKGLAPADVADEESEGDSHLGIVPHQIRGFLSRFQNVLPASKSFDRCTACSDKVISHYKEEGFDFLLKVFNTPNYLEDLTGLSQLFSETLDDQVWELSDEEN